MNRTDFNLSVCQGCQYRDGVKCRIDNGYISLHAYKNDCPVGPFNEPREGGVGDDVKRVLEAVGIKQGKGCGCPKRQAKLNKLIPHTSAAGKIIGAVLSPFASGKRIASETPAQPRPKGRFCYFTASNLIDREGPIIEYLIQSARAVGVQEDIHAFFPREIPGAINHPFPRETPWKNHMAKVDCLSALANLDYDYFVWIDADNVFVRHPGDLLDLLRENPIFVSMEQDLTHPDVKQGDWWEMKFPKVIQIMRERTGRATGPVYHTNGGFWIVRKPAIEQFARRAFEEWNWLRANGYPRMSDEPPLAIVGQSMVRDPENNTVSKHKHVWTCDWMGRFKDKLPDGRPFMQTDWMTQKDIGLVNPAIVHNMRGKHLMKAAAAKAA